MSLRFFACGQPAARPATMKPTRRTSFGTVIHAWTRAVPRRPETWMAAKTATATLARARWAGSAVVASRPRGARRNFADPNADAALGAAKPITNETHPERNAASGP